MKKCFVKKNENDDDNFIIEASYFNRKEEYLEIIGEFINVDVEKNKMLFGRKFRGEKNEKEFERFFEIKNKLKAVHRAMNNEDLFFNLISFMAFNLERSVTSTHEDVTELIKVENTEKIKEREEFKELNEREDLNELSMKETPFFDIKDREYLSSKQHKIIPTNEQNNSILVNSSSVYYLKDNNKHKSNFEKKCINDDNSQVDNNDYIDTGVNSNSRMESDEEDLDENEIFENILKIRKLASEINLKEIENKSRTLIYKKEQIISKLIKRFYTSKGLAEISSYIPKPKLKEFLSILKNCQKNTKYKFNISQNRQGTLILELNPSIRNASIKLVEF